MTWTISKWQHEAEPGAEQGGTYCWVEGPVCDRVKVVQLTDRDLSALRFAASFIRGFEQDLEDRHPDDPNPVTGTREGEATSDVLAAIVARADRLAFDEEGW